MTEIEHKDARLHAIREPDWRDKLAELRSELDEDRAAERLDDGAGHDDVD